MTDPYAFIAGDLDALDASGLRRDVRAVASAPESIVDRGGRRLVQLSSNNYLGLATHPKVVEAAATAALRWGSGTGSARLISGGTTLHDELERALASFKGTEDAVLFSSGYLANLGALGALVGAGDVVLSDAWNHASIIDAVRLSRAHVHVYPHRDLDAVRALLQRPRDARRTLIVTDGVFSMDGDRAPIAELAGICAESSAMLVVDEAHATGVVGPGGRGTVADAGLDGGVVVVGTLSKALGSSGGFVAATAAVCDLIRNRARTFIFDTALPASSTAAALAALEVLDAEPERVVRVCANARTLARGLRAAGFSILDPEAAIVPIVIGDAARAVAFATALEERGILAPAIRPPSVPAGSSRIRASVMATHTEEHLRAAIDAFAAARRGLMR